MKALYSKTYKIIKVNPKRACFKIKEHVYVLYSNI